MGLKLVYGKSGAGKSTYLYNNIKENIEGKNKIYIITPEQFSFTAEKKLMDVFQGEGAVINAEVITFGRMAYRVIKEVGGEHKTNLSKCGKAMLIYSILINEKNNLKFLGKSNENIEVISTQITEFKKHGISVDILKNTTDNTENKYLQCKMNDMLLVYNKFEDSLANKYIDENDLLNVLAENIDKTDLFNNSIFYIDEFVGYTKQEYEVIRKLLKIAEDVNITVCTDKLDIDKPQEIDVFYSNKQTAQKLLNLAEEENVKIHHHLKVENKKARFKSEELLHIEENLYNMHQKKYSENPENVSIFLANNLYSEMEYVASNIVKLVKENGYRFNDISIITKNLESYSNLCKAIFDKYEIPVFIDEKKDLSDNILVKYILSILEIFAKNWSHESVFNYLKTGFIDIEQEEIYELENYCLKWGIKQNKWYSKDWNFHDKDNLNKEKIEMFNELRKKITEPLINLKNNIDKSKDATNIVKELYNFIIDNKINEKLEIKINEKIEEGKNDTALEYKVSFSVLINVFDEIVAIFENEKMTFEKFMQILKIGLGNSGLRQNSSIKRPSYYGRCR